jgi:hypothetical protein
MGGPAQVGVAGPPQDLNFLGQYIDFDGEYATRRAAPQPSAIRAIDPEDFP